MRRSGLVLLLLLPLAACGGSRPSFGERGALPSCSFFDLGTSPSPHIRCLAPTSPPGPAFRTPTPAPSTSPPPSPDTLASASLLLSDNGGEVVLVRGLTPTEALAAMVPGRASHPYADLCGPDGLALKKVLPSANPRILDYAPCLTAQSAGAWTVVYGMNDLTVADGGDALLEKLSADGREAVYIADHFEADAPFSVAKDGKVLRTFDFCSEGSADEGSPLPQEKGLDLKGCTAERFLLVQRLTGVSVTQDLLTGGDRIAVLPVE